MRIRQGFTDPPEGTIRTMSRRPPAPAAGPEAGAVQVRFMPGCLVLSIILSVVGTILLNVLLRLLT